MESPNTWDLLTASLAVADLKQPFAAWAFLVIQGLVRDDPGDREAFSDLVRKEIGRGPITGPSVARRVAGALEVAGIARPVGRTPDPDAVVAAERLAAVARWGGILRPEQLEDLERFRQWVRESRSPARGGAVPGGRGGEKPWWKFW